MDPEALAVRAWVLQEDHLVEQPVELDGVTPLPGPFDVPMSPADLCR